MKKTLYKIVLFLSMGFLILSCTSEFEDMNRNPLTTTNGNPELVFPYVAICATNVTYSSYQTGDNLHANLYAQYIANTSANFSHDRYLDNDSHVKSGYWVPHYVNVLKNVNSVEATIENHPASVNTFQLLRIMRAFSTAKTTDLFGDIPYFEAGKSVEKVAFDSQKDIYYDIFKELTEAVNILKENRSGQNSLDDADFIYKGDISKWIRFANSLRLRYAMRLSFIDPTKAETEVKAAIASGVIESSEGSAYHETNSADRTNGISTLGYPLITISHWSEYRMSKTMEDILLKTSTVEDPRTPLYWGQTLDHGQTGKGPRYKGIPNGLTASQLGTNEYAHKLYSNVYGYHYFSSWNKTWDKNNAGEAVIPAISGVWITLPYPVLLYSEVCFLKAEAAIRSWDTGNAQAYYEEGIKASFSEGRKGVSEELIDRTNDEIYYTTGSVKWNNSDNFETKLEKIITQKWVALFPNGNEAWTEFRRTGYPNLNPVMTSEDPKIDPAKGEFIKKISYLQEEHLNNPENASNPQLNNGQGDGAHVRVWWDTKRYK